MIKQDYRSTIISRASVIAFVLAVSSLEGSGQTADAAYAYDDLGRLERIDYSSGASIVYSYDAAGNRTSVVVTAGNTPPVAVPDSYNQQPGTSVSRNVLANDSDPDGDTLSIASETGSFTSISGNQIMVNAPAPAGVYTFDYTASDGTSLSQPTSVSITVPNVAPVADDDGHTQTHGTTVDHDVLADDTDANGDTLTITSENSGYASIVNNGTRLRFAAPNASGNYTVTYTISDGNGGTDSANTFINVPNAAPNAANNSYTQTHGTTVDHNVLSNDSDPNGDSLTLTSENRSYSSISNNKLRVAAPNASGNYAITYTVSDGNGGTDTAVATVTVPNVAPVADDDGHNVTHGTSADYNVMYDDVDANGDTLTLVSENSPHASIVNNGTRLRFVAPNASGTYTVTYTISDGNGGTDSANSYFIVANVAPNAVNNSYTQTHGTTVDHNVLANDSDPNGDSLTLTGENRSYSSIASNKLRVVAPNSAGNYAITYTVSDGKGGTDTAVATVTVPNAAPNAVADNFTQTHGTTVLHNLIANDSDPNGDSLTLHSENSPHANLWDNKLRFVAPNASGQYSIWYEVSDGVGLKDGAQVNITVPNVAPNAVNISYTQTHGTTVDHNVLGNDSDPNGDSLTLTSENRSYSSIVSNKLRVAAPNASGNYAITYTVSDGKGGTDTAVATIAVPNVTPNALNNSYTQAAGTTVDYSVLSNDSDPNGDPLTLTNENRTYSSIVSNKLRVAAPSSPGTYVITYTVSDGKGGTDTATATINVTAPVELARNSAGNPVSPYYTTTTGFHIYTIKLLWKPGVSQPIHGYNISTGSCTDGSPLAGYSFTGNGCEIKKN